MDSRVCQKLVMHPASRCGAIQSVEAAIARDAPGALRISWRIAGEIRRLRLPAAAQALRADGLWQHSCFEAFLRAGAVASYYEFNLAPSGDWAAWRFGKRRGERSAPELPAPRIERRHFPDGYELSVKIPVAALPELARAIEIEAGVAAVIEADDGSLSYWALAHAGAAPDFHDPSSFLLKVSRP